MLFDVAEERFGPVEILINNASGWCPDTSPSRLSTRSGGEPDRSAKTFDRIFHVDARAAALLISEFARRHVQRGATWGGSLG